MMQKAKVDCLASDGTTSTLTLEIELDSSARIRAIGQDGSALYSTSGADLFDCIVQLRESYLEPQSMRLKCQASRRNVLPSGMSRSMSSGRKAYAVQLGKPARRTDMVDILDPIENEADLATVAEQREFAELWKASLA